jgi:hypothetical protein
LGRKEHYLVVGNSVNNILPNSLLPLQKVSECSLKFFGRNFMRFFHAIGSEIMQE